ncbi:hypothetical protein ACRS64_26990 [Pseudomonas aeruginosa]|uniref:hypothetical protein n=1 Tax=Pseudomonas aeruginosa TaxID=287 RepID=UPI003DA756AB
MLPADALLHDAVSHLYQVAFMATGVAGCGDAWLRENAADLAQDTAWLASACRH